MKKKRMLYRLIFIIILTPLLLGCGEEDASPQSTPTIISGNITPTLTTAIPTLTVTKETLTPTITPTTVPSPTPMPSPSPIVESGAEVESRCGEMTNNLQETALDLWEGIVIESELNSLDGTIFLGSDGAESPAFNWPLAEHGWKTSVSPDGLWLSYFESNFSTEPTTIEIFVKNPQTGQEFTSEIAYEGIEEIEGWLNNSQLFANSLPKMTEQFSIFTWSPFNNEEVFISVELTGFGFHDGSTVNVPIMPVIDPLLEFIIYPCYSSCQDNEYFVKKLDTDEISWAIDIEEPLPKEWRGHPVWSPDGQYIALVGNGFYRDILIFDRNGTEIAEIQLPDPTDSGAASDLFWSPDSKYLGFRRFSLDPEGEPKVSLAYYDLENKSIIDLCIDVYSSSSLMHWSPDSSSIAYVTSPNPLADVEDRILEGYVIDIDSGDYSKFHEAEGNEWDFLVGWAVPISSRGD